MMEDLIILHGQLKEYKDNMLNYDYPDYDKNIVLCSEADAPAVGVKYDQGKLRYDLIPPEAMDALAYVYTIGAAKYSDRNWELGMSWGRLFAALMRHAWAWARGEERDPVDGQLHMASVMWCAAALITYTARKVGVDDRAKIEIKTDR